MNIHICLHFTQNNKIDILGKVLILAGDYIRLFISVLSCKRLSLTQSAGIECISFKISQTPFVGYVNLKL